MTMKRLARDRIDKVTSAERLPVKTIARIKKNFGRMR